MENTTEIAKPYLFIQTIDLTMRLKMNQIKGIVDDCLNTGYLTMTAEEKLRNLLQTTKYGLEDFDAFVKLQEAVIEGLVRQESRELFFEQSQVLNLLIC